jgi:hypothetical protein
MLYNRKPPSHPVWEKILGIVRKRPPIKSLAVFMKA